MKKLLIFCFLVLSLTTFAQAPKWRELSLTNVTGSTIEGRMFNQSSANLSYELGKDYTISSWNGLSYNFYNKQNWFASQTTLDKRWKSLVVGVGYQYGVNSFINAVPSKESYGVLKFQYKIKL